MEITMEELVEMVEKRKEMRREGKYQSFFLVLSRHNRDYIISVYTLKYMD